MNRRTALTVMRVMASPRAGKILIVKEAIGLMVRDFSEVKRSDDREMPGSHSVIVMKDGRLIFTAHAMNDVVDAINGEVNLSITERSEVEVAR
jgi:hypothetical protein